MKLSLRPSFLAQLQPRGLHGGYHRRILSHDHGGSNPMASLPNPASIPTVTYEYLICLPPGEWLRPPTRQQARGLLSRSCTLGSEGRRLWPNKSRYDPVPSNGKRLGNQVCHTRPNPRARSVPVPFLPQLNAHLGPWVASLGSLQSWANDPKTGILGQHNHLMPNRIRHDYWLKRAPDNRHSRANIHAVAT
jgi:hypothetical protein